MFSRHFFARRGRGFPPREAVYNMGMIYLDYNSTTPVLPEVLEAMLPYFTQEWGNPSSTYRFGVKLKGVIETARAQVAGLSGASPRHLLLDLRGEGVSSFAENAGPLSLG